MELLLERTACKANYTIGRLYVENEYFCDTLEPSVNPRCHKLPKAIPPGRYAVVITMSPKFGEYLPLLLRVTHRDGIRIHAGNTAKDTSGCIIVGYNKQVGMVVDSRSALNKLMKRLAERRCGEGIHLTIA